MLARGRAEGAALLPASRSGACRSFWVAGLCLPIFLVLDPTLTSSVRAAMAELTGYAIGWPAYALASLPLCRTMGREALWPRFLVAWNWTNLFQYLIMLAITVLAAAGLPGWLQEAATMIGIGYALWLQWFAAKAVLQVHGWAAAGFVMMDLLLSMLVSGTVADLSQP